MRREKERRKRREIKGGEKNKTKREKRDEIEEN